MGLFQKTKQQETKEVEVLTPTFYPLDVDKLHLADYQRGLRKQRTKNYAEHYDPDIFGIILVSFRDGMYWVIDGQHRVEVAKIKGIKTVWCQVLTDLTYEQECDKFYKINDNRLALNANHKFNALVEKRDREAMDIVKALSKYGLTFSKEGGTAQDNCVTAVGTLRKIYSDATKEGKDGYESLCQVLEIVKKAWSGGRDSLRRDILRGVSTFIKNYDYDKNFLIKTLENDTPMGIVAQSKAHTNNISTRADGNCFYIAKTIRDMYDIMAMKSKNVPTCGYKVG